MEIEEEEYHSETEAQGSIFNKGQRERAHTISTIVSTFETPLNL